MFKTEALHSLPLTFQDQESLFESAARRWRTEELIGKIFKVEDVISEEGIKGGLELVQKVRKFYESSEWKNSIGKK